MSDSVSNKDTDHINAFDYFEIANDDTTVHANILATKMNAYRPTSYSDSAVNVNRQLQQDYVKPTIIVAHSPKSPNNVIFISDKQRSDITSYSDIALRFLFHIMLISMFETLFFFNFVSVYEKQGAMKIMESYINSSVQMCANLTPTIKSDVNYILGMFFNVTQIDNNAAAAISNRMNINHHLYMDSWSYFVIIVTIFVFVSFIPYCTKKKINWKNIIFENISLVVLLGIYEFFFFKNIVIPYVAVESPEVDKLIIDSLQSTCGLLTYK
jgi:hypothetical protein